MIEMSVSATVYPHDILELALKELKNSCLDIISGVASTPQLIIEAGIYGQLIQVFDKYGLKTGGLCVNLKVGYYYSMLYIKDEYGSELWEIKFNRGQAG